MAIFDELDMNESDKRTELTASYEEALLYVTNCFKDAVASLGDFDAKKALFLLFKQTDKTDAMLDVIAFAYGKSKHEVIADYTAK